MRRIDMEPVTLRSVLEKENVKAAWSQVKANDGAAGVDRLDVRQSAEYIAENWEQIEAALLNGRYKPDAVLAVKIPKPNGGERTLGIPTVTDRLIQQAIHRKLSAIWEPDLSEHSYGFRPGRSAHDAVRAAQGYIKAGKNWVIDIDLKSYFDRVNHDKLMSMVSAKIRDKQLLRLIGDYLRAPMQKPDTHWEQREQGTPQGGPLSPLLANIYLDPLDKELDRRGLSFVRYADDIAIFVSSERSARRIMESVIAWIEKHLKVEVNRDKSGCGPSDESALLGFRLHSDGRITISPKAIGRMKEKVRQLTDANRSLTSTQLRDQWRRYIRGWWNYFRLADWIRELEDLSGWIRRHIRKCFWTRWHHPRGRLNALKRLGVKGRALGNAYSAKGAWAMARHFVMNQALKNNTLNRHGFILPWNPTPAVK